MRVPRFDSSPITVSFQALGPMRVKLGNKVFNATTKPLESFLETELATVVAERCVPLVCNLLQRTPALSQPRSPLNL